MQMKQSKLSNHVSRTNKARQWRLEELRPIHSRGNASGTERRVEAERAFVHDILVCTGTRITVYTLYSVYSVHSVHSTARVYDESMTCTKCTLVVVSIFYAYEKLLKGIYVTWEQRDGSKMFKFFNSRSATLAFRLLWIKQSIRNISARII